MVGRSLKTQGTTSADIPIGFLAPDVGSILKLATDLILTSGDAPPIPVTDTFCLVRLRRSDCASRSEMNDEDEPLSLRARTFDDEPSGAITRTSQVISNECFLSFVVAMLVETSGSFMGCANEA